MVGLVKAWRGAFILIVVNPLAKAITDAGIASIVWRIANGENICRVTVGVTFTRTHIEAKIGVIYLGAGNDAGRHHPATRHRNHPRCFGNWTAVRRSKIVL